MKNLIAFGWYGGKYSHLNWLLPLLPPSETFVDVFGGSGAVVLNHGKARRYVYSDIDANLANFFRVLKEDGEALIALLRNTPFSRETYRECLSGKDRTDLEQAARFYTLARQTRTGLGQAGTLSRWASCVTSSTGSMSAVTSRWSKGIGNLPAIWCRLRRITVLHEGYENMLKKHDGEDTLFFLDPPYLPSTRSGNLDSYAEEMSTDQHECLLAYANSVKGKVALSGYDSALYDSMLPSDKWHKHYGPAKLSSASKVGSRQEVLWTNYGPATGKRL